MIYQIPFSTTFTQASTQCVQKILTWKLASWKFLKLGPENSSSSWCPHWIVSNYYLMSIDLW